MGKGTLAWGLVKIKEEDFHNLSDNRNKNNNNNLMEERDVHEVSTVCITRWEGGGKKGPTPTSPEIL